MQTDTVSIEQFVKDNRISMIAEWVDRNPNMDARDMDHWKVQFTRRSEGRAVRMTTYFSMGYGHNGKEPNVADVLDCLASDSSSADQSDFESWCGDLGYDQDSRKAEKTYKACQHAAQRLKNFLGADLYEQLLYSTERM